MHPNLEYKFKKITNLDNPQTIGILYRPPEGKSIEAIRKFDSPMLKVLDRNVILLSTSSYFENSLFCNDMVPVILIATNENLVAYQCLIDNILINSSDNLIGVGLLESRVSHHFPIYA